MGKDSKGHGSDERAYRKEQQATYKAGHSAQAAENRKIMGPTTGKAAQNMRDVVRSKVADGQEAAAKKQGAAYHAVGGKVKAGTPSVARGPGHIDYDKPSKPGVSGNTGKSSHFHASPGRAERVAALAAAKRKK